MTGKKQNREGQQDPQVCQWNCGGIKDILHRLHIEQHPDPGQFKIEKSIGEGNWCFCEWVQEGSPMVKETVLELTDEEFMACYRIIEAECSAQ